MKSNSTQMNTMQMKTASIACISGDHQKTKLLIINNCKIHTLRAGFDTFSATFPSLYQWI